MAIAKHFALHAKAKKLESQFQSFLRYTQTQFGEIYIFHAVESNKLCFAQSQISFVLIFQWTLTEKRNNESCKSSDIKQLLYLLNSYN